MNYKILFLLSFIYLPIFCNRATADDILHSDSISLKYTSDDVLIEVFKYNSEKYLQPISSSLLSSSEIKQNNIVNIKEFSALIPNLFMPDYGSKMTSPVYIRGIGSRINAPSVALYIDGVPYFDRSTFDINVNDIDRIEVLRGPQGTIYGRNTIGGVINVFTKSPFANKGTYVNIQGGSHNNYMTGVSHYGKANEKLAYGLSANYSHAGGYFENTHTGKKADPMDAVSTRARISWRIQPRLTMHLTLAYEYSDQDGYPYRVYHKDTGITDNVNYDAPSYFRRNMSTNGLQVAYVTDEFKLSSQSSFQYFDGVQGLDQDFTPNDQFYVDFYQRQQMYSQEFNIKSLNEESRYKWQFGMFGFHQNYFQTNDVDYRQLNKHAVQHSYNPSEGLAVYHQSTLDDLLVKNLSFAFGLRYDWERTRINFAKDHKEGDRDKTHFRQVTPKASVHYTYKNNSLVYLSVAKGYKTGGFNNTVESQEDKIFDPEYSWSYELGTKSSLLNNRLHVDLCLFYIRWSDQQISQTKASGQGFVLRNAGKTDSKGVELTAQANVIANLDMQLAYGYTNAKYKDYTQNKTLSFDNNYLPMVPRHTISLSGNYTIPIHKKWLDIITLNAQYSGLGKLYWNDANDIDQPFYNTVNSKISFAIKDLSIDVWAKNLTGKEYIAYYFSAMGSDFVQKSKPVTWGVNINYKF